MNVVQGDYAILKRSAAGNAGKKVFVLWEERIDPVLGLLWRVRFERPSTVAHFSTDKGRVVHEGLGVDTDSVVPDAWLMRIDLSAGRDPSAGELLEGDDREAWEAHVKGLGIDLYPEEPSPTPIIEADIKWPDGWLPSPGCDGAASTTGQATDSGPATPD